MSEPADARQPRMEMVQSLRDDLAAVRHPSDGGGRAWLEDVDGPIVAGRRGRFVLIYEAGELGIAEGGRVFLQVSPFWGWSTPQVRDPNRPGFTEVTTGASGVNLDARTLDQQLLGIEISGRSLRAGEQIRIDYGAGPQGAVVDRFAERESRFYLAVDGDGDGVRRLLEEVPSVDVVAGPPARLLLTLPSTARPGERVRLTVAVLDRLGNAGVPFSGEIELEGLPPHSELAELELSGFETTLVLRPEDDGLRTVEFRVASPGLIRLRAKGPEGSGLTAVSNPLQVAERGQRVLWADLQNHSNLSDGTALPEDLFRYARDVAALDAVALTDHDHWGLYFLDQTPRAWRRILDLNERFHEPGRFVTIPGYEWTSWIHGHRHVLFFEEIDVERDLFSSIDPRYETPQQLWEALRGRRALTIAHHSAGGPIATDWTIPPDPELEPVTEIVSVHGSSEAPDSPSRIYQPVPGNFVRDALDRGYRLGFLGSSDGHDGHPGLGHLASATGGLAAILADELSREAIYEALRARRVYGTSGPRILLRVSLGGYRMGSDVPASVSARAALEGAPDAVPGLSPNSLVVQIDAPSELAVVDIVRSGQVIERVDCDASLDCSFGVEFESFEAGEYLYLRVVQRDGGLAWSSPFFFY